MFIRSDGSVMYRKRIGNPKKEFTVYGDTPKECLNKMRQKELELGAAVINECDCIISWNFKHIVNVKIIRGGRAITNLEGYKMIEIWNPSVLLESEV